MIVDSAMGMKMRGNRPLGRRWWQATALGTLGLSLLVSCAGSKKDDASKRATAEMDIALDTAGGRMFYKGTAAIPRGFNSSSAFSMDVQLTHWGNAPGNAASEQAARVLGEEFSKSGRYQPLGNGEGEIQLARGRIQLRGVILDEGQELDGDWFIDGQFGGGFRISPDIDQNAGVLLGRNDCTEGGAVDPFQWAQA